MTKRLAALALLVLVAAGCATTKPRTGADVRLPELRGIVEVYGPVEGIGFNLPDGTRSTCGSPRCVDPSFPVINEAIPVTDHDTMVGRYCGGHEAAYGSCDITVGNTQHSTDMINNLEDVCQMNPGFFAANRIGTADGVHCTPSANEIYDAYFTQNNGAPGYLLFKEAVRLRCIAYPSPACGGTSGPVCGDGRLDFGETCLKCPQDHPPGDCAPPPEPPAQCPALVAVPADVRGTLEAAPDWIPVSSIKWKEKINVQRREDLKKARAWLRLVESTKAKPN